MSGAEDLEAMARMLSGLRWRFAVREPAKLAEALRAHYKRLGDSVARSNLERPVE